LLGLRLTDGTELGTKLDETSGRYVGPLLGGWLVDDGRSEDELPIGLDDGSEIVLSLGLKLKDGIELGVELGGTAGMLVGLLLDTLVVDVDGTEDGVGLDDGSKIALLLGLRLTDGTEVNVELGEATGMSAGPLLGTLRIDSIGAVDGLPL
jgi:hypothetical protein